MAILRYTSRALPKSIEALVDLALDLRWSWDHAADALWKAVDSELWEATQNPWLILETVSESRLEELAHNARFLQELARLQGERAEQLGRLSWFDTAHGKAKLSAVAYFSMEFGLSEALPIYSGGLGILAGDYLKTASDLGVPVVGVGLLYQRGYFRQAFDAEGEQLAFFPYNDPVMLPITPLRSADGEWLRVAVELPGRTLNLRAWQVRVGRVRLYLLDSNDPLNLPADRGITGELYGGNTETRLLQEIALGIGGWRLLERLKLNCEVCHLNEGHAAFAALERARWFMERNRLSFAVALRATRAGNLFTTHTPVEAGFDRFAPALFAAYFSGYALRLGIGLDQLMALGRPPQGGADEPFNMSYLAIRLSGAVNAVSRLHAQVSRRIFQPLFPRWHAHAIAVGSVTNGVHAATWDSSAAERLWRESTGVLRWHENAAPLGQSGAAPSDEALWEFRSRQRAALVNFLRARSAVQLAQHGLYTPASSRLASAFRFDPAALTLGLARRFAAYKRPCLLLHDPERLTRLVTDPRRPVQLIVAGKAHPHDNAGRALVRRWVEYMHRPEVADRAIFVDDYDMAIAARLLQGIDLWINTPRRPWEACGTSGMKVIANGGLHLSTLDGWWAEAYAPQLGWAFGSQREDDDPARDAADAEELYALLEREVVPAFYNRNPRGIPEQWVARMRQSMTRLGLVFAGNRMVREYTERYYLPAAAALQARAARNCELAQSLEAELAELERHWHTLRFGPLEVSERAAGRHFRVVLELGAIDPERVSVGLYADPLTPDGAAVWIEMERGQGAGAARSYLYEAATDLSRPAGDYTPCARPHYPMLAVPLETPLILWLR